jgi:hypothetical protein
MRTPRPCDPPTLALEEFIANYNRTHTEFARLVSTDDRNTTRTASQHSAHVELEDPHISSSASAAGPAYNTSAPPTSVHMPQSVRVQESVPDLVDEERRVSHIYCRMCRLDPCRRPMVTMCGHIFCERYVLYRDLSLFPGRPNNSC